MPPVSEAQRRAMFAAAEGRSTLGIPPKVGREFIGKDMKRSDWRGLISGLVRFFSEEEDEPEHAGDAEPKGYAASVMFVSPAGKVLFVKRADTEENFPGHWALPGGKVDAGEGIEDCARRECREEIGDRSFDGMTELDRKLTDRGWVHTTFSVPAAEEFTPTLNAEHSAHQWAAPDDSPQPLHPGVAASLTKMATAAAPGAQDEGATDMALDRSSARTYDADGRLHVERSNISKSAINEYWGREIPNSAALGLEPDRKYRMLRDPVELERAAATFNNLPILSAHVPVTAEAHKPELVIGSTGTDAKFEAPYLTNSLVFWTKEAIDPIESGEQRELSSAYRYRADMTPGTYQNEPYDGVMRDIKANHVVICREGRAGPDVMVGDSKESKPMKTRLTSLLAQRAIKKLGLSGVSRDALALAMDEDMEGEDELDPNSALPAGLKKKAEDDAETEEEKAERLRNRAEDAKLGLACAGDEDPETKEEREERMERREAADKRAKDARTRMGRDESEEERMEREKKERAEDRKARDSKRAGDAKRARDAKGGKDEEKKDMVDKAAMDAAIQAASDATARRVTAEVRATERAIREAENEVRPYVGELAMSFDSAEEVKRHALGLLKVPEAKTIHASALSTILSMQPKAGARPSTQTHATAALGMDAVSKAIKIAPGLAHIGIGAI